MEAWRDKAWGAYMLDLDLNHNEGDFGDIALLQELRLEQKFRERDIEEKKRLVTKEVRRAKEVGLGLGLLLFASEAFGVEFLLSSLISGIPEAYITVNLFDIRLYTPPSFCVTSTLILNPNPNPNHDRESPKEVRLEFAKATIALYKANERIKVAL